MIRSIIRLICLASCLTAVAVVADERLESHSFGNINESRFARIYPELKGLMVGAHVIPGLRNNFVPQGFELLDAFPGEAVLSGYFCDRFSTWWQGLVRHCRKKRSALYWLDVDSGKPLRLALLEERDGRPMRRHAGGVAELHGRLWVPDNFVVFRFNLERLRGADHRVITMRPENDAPIRIDSSGDYVTAFDGRLWVGNFQRRDRGRPLPAHYESPQTGTEGWTAGYRIDPETLRPQSRQRYRISFAGVEHTVLRPDAALHHRNKVQGMAFMDERRVVLSASYGDRFSALAFHLLPESPPGGRTFGWPVELPDGSTLHVQSLSLETRRTLLAAPPGAEGVAFNDAMLGVAFEGGAMPYRRRWSRIEDRLLLFLPPPVLAIDEGGRARPQRPR